MNNPTHLVETVKAIGLVRNAMIFYSFVPLLFMALSSILYLTFADILNAVWGIVAFCMVIAIFSTILLFKSAISTFVSQAGLIFIILASLLFASTFLFSWSANILGLSSVFIAMGIILFACGLPINIGLKICHTAFFAICIICAIFFNSFPRETIAIIALSTIAYPMITSYMAVKWASQEFLNATNQ